MDKNFPRDNCPSEKLLVGNFPEDLHTMHLLSAEELAQKPSAYQLPLWQFIPM